MRWHFTATRLFLLTTHYCNAVRPLTPNGRLHAVICLWQFYSPCHIYIYICCMLCRLTSELFSIVMTPKMLLDLLFNHLVQLLAQESFIECLYSKHTLKFNPFDVNFSLPIRYHHVSHHGNEAYCITRQAEDAISWISFQPRWQHCSSISSQFRGLPA